MADTGAYGINKVGLDAAASAQGVKVNVHDGLEYSLPSGDPANPVKVGILGITNHRVPNYELPSNIPGLTFTNPIATAQNLVPVLRGRNDVVVALTHIGFTENPKSVEVDDNVDTNLAAQVPGIDAIIGSHSHTNPASPAFGAYKYLPTIVGGPNNIPVLINQAYRYNNTLGEVVIGVRAKAGGGYEVVSRAGRYLSVVMTLTPTPEDAAIKAIVDPYATDPERLQQHGHRPDRRADRHAAGLHPGDQRRQPAGRRLGVRAGQERHHRWTSTCPAR